MRLITPEGNPATPGNSAAVEAGASSEGSEPESPEVEFKTKKEHAGHLLERGTTAAELMRTLGWPSISVPATARSLGMNLEKIKEGRIIKYKGTPMTAAERAKANLPPEGIKRSGGPASRPPHTFSLLEYIASRGGIDPKDALIGDVRSVFGTKNRFIPGFGTLIRPNGMKLDRLREAVVEAGYIQDAGFNRQNVQETTTIRDLLDAMDTENRGERIYQYGQIPEHEQAKQQEHIDEENYRHSDELLDDALDYAGLGRHSVDGQQRERVLEIMLKEGIRDPLEALEQEAMEWVTHASETGEINRILDDIPGWDIPHDPGAAPQPSRTAAPG